MLTLGKLINEHIFKHGPMPLHEYMSLCLYHNTLGYYYAKQPIGKQGDFTTAPEISPLFGECVAFYIALLWEAMGEPQHFQIVELGPGRGTLTRDIASTLTKLPSFAALPHFHLVETSPLLRAHQEQLLESYSNVTWHHDLNTVPKKVPSLIIANEFFDALPIDQYLLKEGVVYKKHIALEGATRVFKWIASGLPAALPLHENSITEYRPLQTYYMKQIAGLLNSAEGALLAIDYGYIDSTGGDTFQAVQRHQYTDPLAFPGDADLTSHINFTELDSQGNEKGLSTAFLGTQGRFLQTLGIHERLALLEKKQPKETFKQIKLGASRLIDFTQMGELFKVYVGASSKLNLKGIL